MTKNPSFKPDFTKVKNPRKNRWNQYLNANKGKGKRVKELAKDYNKLMTGKKGN